MNSNLSVSSCVRSAAGLCTNLAINQEVKKDWYLHITSMTSSGIKALIRKFNLCLWATACGRLRLTCCAEWEWQENNPCLCACPVIKARRGASETLPLLPLPLLWLPSGHPWPSHRHPGSKMRASNPFFLPLCVCNCLCALCACVYGLVLTYLSKHALLAEHSSILVFQG